MHDIFYVLLLKFSIGFVHGSSGDTPHFWPPVDNSGKFKIKDILDSCFVNRGC